MVIDIISYTETQLSYLSVEQLEEVRTAQLKKNALIKKKEELCEKEAFRLQKNGVYRTPIYTAYCNKMETEYGQKIEEVRQALLFYLQYTSRPNGTLNQQAPYIVNYALPMVQRVEVVRNYYESAYTQAEAVQRFNAFEKDEVAVMYLGEYYASVYSIYREEAKEQGGA